MRALEAFLEAQCKQTRRVTVMNVAVIPLQP